MRLFLAVEVPEAHRLSVERATEPLRPLLRGARFLPAGSWHVTLKFLGEVPEGRLDKVCEAAAAAAAGCPVSTVTLAELGAFPNVRHPRVLWVGLDDPQGSLRLLVSRMEKEFAARGWRKESRPWHPHLTVARFRVPAPIGDVLGDV
ncbi:MAG: RNA 2',3'-cyclic phosphodiesterase, partial [Actinomycetota bacterium]